LNERALAKLAKREVLRVDPSRSIAIKRNVHDFVVDVPAKRFARAFHEVMTEPDARFGRIDVRRDPARRGEPFAVGERFHGCFSFTASMPRFARAMERVGLRGAATWIEDSFCSDYSEITRLVESDGVFAASYAYLSGSPIAGESRFEITALGSSRCRLEAVFAYQEIGALAVLVLHLFAARLHDDVVLEQVQRSAARAGGRLVSATTGFVAREPERRTTEIRRESRT
jgi:hypothetical protein